MRERERERLGEIEHQREKDRERDREFVFGVINKCISIPTLILKTGGKLPENKSNNKKQLRTSTMLDILYVYYI